MDRCKFSIFRNTLQLGRQSHSSLATKGQHCSVLPVAINELLLVYCLSLSINHELTGSESPHSAVIHCTTRGGAGPQRLIANYQLATPSLTLLALRDRGLKKLNSLEVKATKCTKLTFGSVVTTPAEAVAAASAAQGDERGVTDHERVETDVGLARVHF